uniref:Uncharacterized protein n=1 Tax=Tanacetum cinerariifolium TaxID=118510 RepID=A0A6L2M7Q2_TANCI|nr:hypothetical protein [Tanacetum cinerariifolium]
MAAASSSPFILSKFTHKHTPTHTQLRPSPPSISVTSAAKKHPRHLSVVSCLISGVDGGGVSDDLLSRKRSDREFSVIANMLKKIEPLDTSVISKGVSESSKDSMKQTISTMLGLLPSDQFDVMVRVSKGPLHRLLSSSLITGYTLWNAEYRIMLMRNFEISPSDVEKKVNCGEEGEVLEGKDEGSECLCDGLMVECCSSEESERLNMQSCLGDLGSEALSYVQRLESELSAAKKELHARKQENMQIENTRENDNDLLKYLRSLDPDMVNELSRPSSTEVEEVIRELVQCTARRFFKEETISDLTEDSDVGSQENHSNDNDDFCDTIGTSRDYLAKLLFWCMLLGHHLRGLENRLHLSCAVGLL